MKTLYVSSVAVASLVTALVSSQAPAASSDARSSAPGDPPAAACGDKDKGQPPCPTQKWMKANMTTDDGKALADAFKYVAGKAPSGDAFKGWADLSNAAAKLAAEGKVDEAKKACKSCHSQYKEAYKAPAIRGRAF